MGRLHALALATDYTNMFEGELFSDVEVKCEDRTFKCHKNVLAARSKVFAAMLTGNFREGQDNAIVIGDMDAEVLHILLHYVYSGTVKKEDFSIKLFRAAHLYEVSALANECCHVLARSITVDNCCEILEVAHLYDRKQLFDRAVVFFKGNKRTLLDSPMWKSVATNISLINAVLAQM
jgi:hypothetical protein